jgi:S1-C subfamily serine protease
MNPEVLKLLTDLNAGMADVIDRVHRGLVHISNGRGAGAGTIWHPDGLIVTNAHVVQGRQHLKATLPDGRTLPARLLAADPDRDLAALSVDATDLPTIEIGDSRSVRPGQWVMAVGHPWGIQGSVTSGVVIGSGDSLPEMRPGRDWIALSLHMRPGHSGGPLVDSQARLIGINTMITGPDVGFAIPVQTVKAFLKDALGSPATTV